MTATAPEPVIAWCMARHHITDFFCRKQAHAHIPGSVHHVRPGDEWATDTTSDLEEHDSA